MNRNLSHNNITMRENGINIITINYMIVYFFYFNSYLKKLFAYGIHIPHDKYGT